MKRFRSLNIIVICLILASSVLVSCQRLSSVPTIPTMIPTPAATPTTKMVTVHSELEVITPDNISRLKQIDQWGQGDVFGMALSPDGSLIAVSTTTGVYLYDRKMIAQVDFIDIRIGNEDEVEDQNCLTSGNLAFGPDGSTLAIANTDITLWNLKTRVIQKVIENKIKDTASIITEIQFSADGSRILGVQKKASPYFCYYGWGSLAIYAVETGELIFRRDYDRYEEGLNTRFHEKNGKASIWYFDRQKKEGNLFLEVDIKTGDVLKEKPSPENIEMINAVPHTDKMIVREPQKLTVRTLDGEVHCSKPTSADAENSLLPTVFSRDGSIALSWNDYGDRAGNIYIWDLAQCRITGPVLVLPEVERQISVSSDSRSVLTGSSAGPTFYVFDAQTGQLRFLLSGFDAKFSADGQQVYVVEDEAVNAYDVDTGEYQYPMFETHSDGMTEMMVSPDGRFLAINNGDRQYRMIPIRGRAAPSAVLAFGNGDPVFSRDGKLVAAIQDRLGASELRFWDLNTGSEITEWQGLVPSDAIYLSYSFNSNFTHLATLATDGYSQYVYLWKVPELSLAQVLPQFSQHIDRPTNSPIESLEFISGDRLLFARGSHPDAFLFWNIQTGELLQAVPAEVHESMMGNPIAFSPDGRLLLVLDSDGTIHVWGIK